MVINSQLLKQTAGQNRVKPLHMFDNIPNIVPQKIRVNNQNFEKIAYGGS